MTTIRPEFDGPEDIDLEKFKVDYAVYVRNVDDVKELLKIPFERHQANFQERLGAAANCLEKIRTDLNAGDGSLQSQLRDQYYHLREQANASIKQIKTYQSLYVFLETEVHSKLEEALVLQHLSKAGANFMEQANRLKSEAANNIQEMMSIFDDLGVSLPTIYRKIGTDHQISDPAGDSKDPTAQDSYTARVKIYDKDIDDYLDKTDGNQTLPPSNSQ